jgi:hypothetical protein
MSSRINVLRECWKLRAADYTCPIRTASMLQHPNACYNTSVEVEYEYASYCSRNERPYSEIEGGRVS